MTKKEKEVLMRGLMISFAVVVIFVIATGVITDSSHRDASFTAHRSR